MKDYYKILDLPPSATQKEIKAAYRRLAHQYHPDKNSNDQYAAARFELVKEAYEVLTDPAKKEYYLQQRWYHQSMGKKRTETVITPVTVLKEVLDLDKHVATLDVYRMDEEGLYIRICEILSDDTISRINLFNEREINNSIAATVLKIGHTLSWTYIRPLSARLLTLQTDQATGTSIRRFMQQSKQSDTWQRHKAWIILLIVVLLCLLIYSISN